MGHQAPVHIPHLTAPFARQLGRLVRATIDEHRPDDAKGTAAAAIHVYGIVENHAMDVLRRMGVDHGEFAIQLHAALAQDVDDLDRVATRAEQAAEDAEYQRVRKNLGLAG